jgi:hypothetical protein
VKDTIDTLFIYQCQQKRWPTVAFSEGVGLVSPC